MHRHVHCSTDDRDVHTEVYNQSSMSVDKSKTEKRRNVQRPEETCRGKEEGLKEDLCFYLGVPCVTENLAQQNQLPLK